MMEKSELQRFRSECVAAHNFFRAIHGTPPLGWSSKLADSAQLWAEQLAVFGTVRNSSETNYGENLTSLWGSELTGQKVTRIWYEEGRHFDYDKPRLSSRTRSFCQVIWEGSREFGAGAAVTKHGKKIVVARYYPPANKKDVAKNVKRARITQEHDNECSRAFDTRWSRLYLGLKQFHEECLEAHNDYRLRHGAAPLRWSASLAWEAQQWAEELARNGELRHNDDDTVGENLAGMLGGELSGREAVDMWYDEIESYDFDNPRYDEETSNFTQVVWVATESLGVGRAIEGDLCVAVAFYEPPGNMEGAFGDNVLRMGSTLRVRKIKESKRFIPPPPDLDNFRVECLVTHNYYRARHGSPPLVLSSALTDEAQYWAERLLVTGASEDLDNSRIGICVAVLDTKRVSGIKVSESWYKQILNYDFNSPGFSSQTRDFTQLVWLSSRKLGVGKASGGEGVTVVVARYEPVGNIDGLFVQNVKRRGHERGSCEPMIFHVELRYRMRTDSKSTNSFLSWENEGTQTFCEVEKDVTKSSELDEFDENQNIVHRVDDQDPHLAIPGDDHFTRLVWIDPQSPTLQRRVTTQQEKETREDEEVEKEKEKEKEKEGDRQEEDDNHGSDEEDARTVEEQENRDLPISDLTLVTEEPPIHSEEADSENAVLYSDPEDDISEHFCEIRRSLSLDSNSTEPEMQKGNVLHKVAFFEAFQQSGFPSKSPSSSGSSLRRSFIQEEVPELSPLPEGEAPQDANERDIEEEGQEEEHECQLEYEDVFPAHREEEEVGIDGDEDIYEQEADEDEESLVSVSDAEETLDFMDYSHEMREHQSHRQYDNFCVTHEIKEEDPNDVEISDAYEGDASSLYAEVTEEEGEPTSSTKPFIVPLTISTASEFQNSEPFQMCNQDSPELMEEIPDNFKEESCRASESEVQVPLYTSKRTVDPDFCCITTKQDVFETRLKELSSRIDLASPVEDSDAEESIALFDFDETKEGKQLLDIFENYRSCEAKNQEPPIEEFCEAVFKDNVHSEINVEEFHFRVEKAEKADEEEESIEAELKTTPDKLQCTWRDLELQRSGALEEISDRLGLVSVDDLDNATIPNEQELELNITLGCQSKQTFEDQSIAGLVSEDDIEAVERRTAAEHEVSLQNFQERTEIAPSEVRSEQKISHITIPIDFPKEEQFCKAVVHDHSFERELIFEQVSPEIGLLSVSSEESYCYEEPSEFLQYDQAPKTLLIRDLPEVTEHIKADVRSEVRCELNFDVIFGQTEYEQEQTSSEISEAKPITKEEKSELIANEAVNRDILEESECVQASEEKKTASLYLEEDMFVIEVKPEGPSSPVHIANEGENRDVLEEILGFEPANAEKRASVFLEEDVVVKETTPDGRASPRHIANESLNIDIVEESEEVQTIKEENRASLFIEEGTSVEEATLERPSSPRHITDECVGSDLVVETDTAEIESLKRASLFLEENTFVAETTLVRPSSPRHLADEKENRELSEETEVINVLEKEESASEILEEVSFVEEAALERPSSPRHKVNEGDSSNFDEVIEEIEKDIVEKRASLSLEENVSVEDTRLDRPSSPKYIANKVVGIDMVEGGEATFERPPKEHIVSEGEKSTGTEETENIIPMEETKRTSLVIDEYTVVGETQLVRPSSPRHIANEGENSDAEEEIDVKTVDEGEMASEIIEERTFVDEDKRASLFLEEQPCSVEVPLDTISSSTHIAGELSAVVPVEESAKMVEAEDLELAQEFEERDADVSCDNVPYEFLNHGTHVAGDIASPVQLEVAAEYDSSVSDYGEQFEEFEGIFQVDQPKEIAILSVHVAGEVTNNGSHDEAPEGVVHLEETLEFEDDQSNLTTTQSREKQTSSFHVAGEVSNVEPLEESSEEEKPEEEEFAEEFEENEVHTTTVTLKCPQSLLTIAAAALELKIDAAQQDVDGSTQLTADDTMRYNDETVIGISNVESGASPPSSRLAEEIEETQEYAETSEAQIVTESHAVQQDYATSHVQITNASLDVPVISIQTTGDISSSEEEEAFIVKEVLEEQEREEMAESYHEREETRVLESSEEVISQSHVAGDSTLVELQLVNDEIREETDTAVQLENNEVSVISESTYEVSLPIQTSTKLRHIQDCAISIREERTHSQLISEETMSANLPSSYITGELVTQNKDVEESVEKEVVDTLDTAREYDDDQVAFKTETSFALIQPPLQMAAKLSDADFGEGVDEDDLSKGEFSERSEEVDGQRTPQEEASESMHVADEVQSSGPHAVEKDNKELVEEIESSQEISEQERPVRVESQTTCDSSVFVTTDIKYPNHQEDNAEEDVQDCESVSQYEETEEVTVLEKTSQACSPPLYLAQELVGQDRVETISTENVMKNEGDKEISQVSFTAATLPDDSQVEQSEEHELQTQEAVDIRSTAFEGVSVASTVQVSSDVERHVVISQTQQRSREMQSAVSTLVQKTEMTTSSFTRHDTGLTIGREQVELESSDEMVASDTVKQVSLTSFQAATRVTSQEIQYKRTSTNGADIHYIEMLSEVKKAHKGPLKMIQISDEKTAYSKKENGRRFETTVELNEAILEKEVEDREEQKLERELSVEETEVRLMKREVIEQRTAELESHLVQEGGVETMMRSLITQPVAENGQTDDQESREDSVADILREDEASLEEESAGEQLEEEIDIMRVDEALSEEEFRGEGAEVTDLGHSREIEPDDFEQQIDWQESVDGEQEEDTEPCDSDGSESLYEEEVEIREVQPVYEEEFEIQRVQEEKRTKPYVSKVQESVFEEEIEVVACTVPEEPEKEQFKKEEDLRAEPPVLEEEVEVLAQTDRKGYDQGELVKADEIAIGSSVSKVESQDKENVPLIRIEGQGERPLSEDDDQPGEEQLQFYEGDEAVMTRYYVDVSSLESLEPVSEEAEDEPSYMETYVRQGDPLEENLEEFILVRYGDGDEYDSSGEEDVGDHREIYVIPEEENDVDEHSVRRGSSEDSEEDKEPHPESCYEQGYENIALEEIRESPEFEIDDSADDELDEEEQRQLEEYERLESFVILEEKLSQVESDEEGDEEIAAIQAGEGSEDVFHSDLGSSQETLHEEELVNTMTSSGIRGAMVISEAAAQETDSSSFHYSEELPHEDVTEGQEVEVSEVESREITFKGPVQPLDEDRQVHESSVEGNNNVQTGDKGDLKSQDNTNGKEAPQTSEKREEKADQSPSSDSCGEQSVSSEGSLSSTHSVDLEGLEEFEQDCLMQHNLYRRQHRAKPLVWSDELAAGAEEWAKHLCSLNSLEHSQVKDVGENLASAQGKQLNGTAVVEMWYAEASEYNFEVPAFNAKCGNFTNVVWASSREFGVAKCVAEDGTLFVVARYKPMGNVVGEFKENVKPPREASGRLRRRRSSGRRRSGSGVPPFTPAEREKFKNECVISHNYYRTLHGAPTLRWSPLLAAEAQNYAERLAKTDSLTHSGQKDRGENLAITWDCPLSASTAVDMWYDEVQDYDFDCPGFTSDTGHFSQVVWVETEEFGMGMAVAPDGRNIIVGRYFPPGNIVGQFQENVRPKEIGVL